MNDVEHFEGCLDGRFCLVYIEAMGAHELAIV